jgi:hypothetical protein
MLITRSFLETRSGLLRLLIHFRYLQHGVCLLSTPIPVSCAGGTISGWVGKGSPQFGTSSIEETESHTNRFSDRRLHPDGRGIQTSLPSNIQISWPKAMGSNSAPIHILYYCRCKGFQNVGTAQSIRASELPILWTEVFRISNPFRSCESVRTNFPTLARSPRGIYIALTELREANNLANINLHHRVSLADSSTTQMTPAILGFERFSELRSATRPFGSENPSCRTTPRSSSKD